MRFTITGATGTLGRDVVKALRERGDEVTALSRDAERAASILSDPAVKSLEWREPKSDRPPADALAGRDVVINLLGEPLAQRWNSEVKRELRDSRVFSTRNLVAAIAELAPADRPSVLISQSATGWYGPRGDERVDETTPHSDDFLGRLCADWEAEAQAATELGLRVAVTRTGVVISEDGGALERMLPPFKLGVGGPIAGGDQYVPWIDAADVVAALIFTADQESASGPINLTAPEPVTNAQLSKTLGRVLKRPAITPVPAFAIKLLYGEMSIIVTTGARAVPSALAELGFRFTRPELEDALRHATGRPG